MKNRKRTFIAVLLIFIVVVLLLCILLWFRIISPIISSPEPPPEAYKVENPRMAICDTQQLCRPQEVQQVSSTSNICIAWTDVNRGDGDLIIRIYDTQGTIINTLRDPKSNNNQTRECRQLPIGNIRPGVYRIDFAYNGRPVEGTEIRWSIVTPTPTP